jgi:hypothetical protein
MRKRISLLLIFAFLASATAAQQRVREKTDDSARTADGAQRQAEVAQRRTQAVDILKSVVEGAPEIREMPARVAVLTSALDLLWKHDEAYTRATFIKSAAALSDRFSSATDRRGRSEIRTSIGVLLKAFARRDPYAAEQQLDKFEKLLEEVVKGNSVSPGERMSLAQAGLESDAAQSAALAAKVLETGVPGAFASYLNELEQRDSAAATSLFLTAMSIMSRGNFYNPAQVTILSAYVFRESQMSVPMATGKREGAPLEFGMFASPLSPPSRNLNVPLVRAYLEAVGSYLYAELVGLEQRSAPDAIHVALCFFLVKKVRGYADKLGLDRGQNWAVLDARFSVVAERAQLSTSALNGLATVAQRIVTENNVFRFDGGEAAFAAAEKAVDPGERAELFATGIRHLIDDGKYTEALQKIDEVKDDKFREQLNTYRNFRMAEASLRRLDWSGFNSQANSVTDAQLRTFLVLSAALAANEASKKDTASEFLVAAMALVPKIDDANARAAALVTTAGIVFGTADASWGAQILSDGVKAINRAERYDGRVYGVMLEAPHYKVWLPVAGSDLNHLFEQVAKGDWTGSLAAAQGIDSKVLRSHAYIAACRNTLM